MKVTMDSAGVVARRIEKARIRIRLSARALTKLLEIKKVTSAQCHGQRALFVALAFAVMPVGQAAADENLQSIEAQALAGDYQAQRNLAYGYSDMPYAGQKKDPVAACAWRMVIVASGRADQSDLSNHRTNCSKLAPDGFRSAMHTAGALMQRIAQ